MPDRPEMVLRLTQTLAGLDKAEPLPLRLCRAVVEIVSARDGSISVGLSGPERTLLCATSEAAARFEDAQDLLREGPSLEVLRTGRAVLSPTREDRQRRWPGLADAVADVDAAPGGAVLALPMRPGLAVIGVLTVHHRVDVDAPAVVTGLDFLADAVGAAIVGDLPSEDSPSTLWSERDRVSQATGMVVAQLDLTAADALAVLRAHAYAEATSVLEVSRRVIGRELDFRTGGRAGSS